MSPHRQIHFRLDPRRSRIRMIKNQLEARGIRESLVLAAMGKVPRHLFVQEALSQHAYSDAALPIGYGQTISQPYIVARITESIEPQPGLRVLEIGAGCGYQAAVLAEIGMHVYAIERLRPIYQLTAARLRQLGYGRIQLRCGDGTLGWPSAAPFDRIIVSAGGPQVPPPLVAQLGEAGILVIPVGDQQGSQRLFRLRKLGGKISQEDLGPAGFVNLVGDHGWSETI